MTLALAGVSHHRTPVEERERVALDRTRAAETARALAAEGAEAVCLSTCNRTEVYVVHADAARAEALATGPLADGGVAGSAYRLRDDVAALHLLRVAAGLDSLVPGEGEILGQVRDAHELGAPGPVLDRLFRQGLWVGRKVRAETGVGERPASVAAAAATLAEQVLDDLCGKRVLLIGAGKTSDLAARNLTALGAHVAVANRTMSRAATVAARVGADAAPLTRLRDELELADVVVSSTAAPDAVVTRADVEAVRAKRNGRPLFLIDLAVPRDVEPSVREVPDCFVYDIDDLEDVAAPGLAGLRREMEAAESIVAAEAERFRAWLAARDVVPAIASLRARAEDIRAAELAKLDGVLARLPDRDRRALQATTAQIVNKLLHLPTVRMKQAAVTADGVLYAAAVRHLFGLADDERA